MIFFRKCWIILPIVYFVTSTHAFAQLKHLGHVEEKYNYSHVLQIAKESEAFLDKFQQEFETALIEFTNLLSQNMNEENIIEAKKLLSVAIYKLADYEKNHLEIYAVIRTKISNAFKGNEKEKNDFFKGFDKGSRVTQNVMKEYFCVEKESLKLLNDLLNFYSAKLGTFQETENDILFENDEDLQTFNQFMIKLNELAQQEDVITEKIERIQENSARYAIPGY